MLRDKAAQAEDSGATWLLLAIRDGLWQFTEWSAYTLADKTHALSEHCLATLACTAFHGVIFTSGSLHGQGNFVDESCRTPNGSAGLRRALPLHRVRESVVVPLRGGSMHELEAVVRIYDEEATWLGWALSEAGLPTIDAVVRFSEGNPSADSPRWA